MRVTRSRGRGSRWAARSVAVVASAVVALTGVCGAAGATSDRHPPAQSWQGKDLRAQSRQVEDAHVWTGNDLTTRQRQRLDRRLDRVLADSPPGGERVGPNQIVWKDRGVTLTIPVKRGLRAHGVGENVAANCPDKYFCAYSGTYGRGWRLAFYYCRFENFWDYPWFTYQWMRSYQNAQNTYTLFYYDDGYGDPYWVDTADAGEVVNVVDDMYVNAAQICTRG